MFKSLDLAFGNLFAKGVSSPSGSGMPFLFSGGASTKAGQKVNETTALKLSAYFGALNLIAKYYAMLPKSVYVKDGDSKKLQADHPVHFLIHEEPNDNMTSSTFDELMVWSYFNRGNAIGPISRAANGSLVSIGYWNPDEVTPLFDDDKLFYRYKGKVYTSSEVFHVPAFSENGLWGRSLLHFAADNLGISLAAEQFQGNSYDNKGLSTGVIETDKVVSKPNKELLQKAFANAMSSDDPYRVAALDEGMKYKPISLTLEQAKILESKEISVADIGRFFNVPLSKLNVSGEGGYNFLVQMNIEFLNNAIVPLADKFKKEYRRKLFTKEEKVKQGLTISYTTNKLLQADPKTRAEYYKTMVAFKLMTPNEVRKLEGQNPYKGGDQVLQMVNMQTQEQIDQSLNTEKNA